MNPDGTISDHAPIQYQGLDRFDARRKIVEDLELRGYWSKSKTTNSWCHEVKNQALSLSPC
jgi:valyl-tRNA synthetase